MLQTRSRFQHFPETTAGTHNVICSGKGPALIKENSARSGMPELPNDLAASRLAAYARMSQNGGEDHDLTRCDFGQGAPRHQYLVGRRFTKSSALHPIRSAKQNKHVITVILVDAATRSSSRVSMLARLSSRAPVRGVRGVQGRCSVAYSASLCILYSIFKQRTYSRAADLRGVVDERVTQRKRTVECFICYVRCPRSVYHS